MKEIVDEAIDLYHQDGKPLPPAATSAAVWERVNGVRPSGLTRSLPMIKLAHGDARSGRGAAMRRSREAAESFMAVAFAPALKRA